MYQKGWRTLFLCLFNQLLFWRSRCRRPCDKLRYIHTITDSVSCRHEKLSDTVWTLIRYVTLPRGGSRIFFRRGCTRLLLYFNTNKPHFFFLGRIPVVLENRRSSLGRGAGGAHPLHPSPRSAPAPLIGATQLRTVGEIAPNSPFLCVNKPYPV